MIIQSKMMVMFMNTNRMFELRRIMLNSDFTLILPRIFGLSSANGKGAALLRNRHKRAAVQLELCLVNQILTFHHINC